MLKTIAKLEHVIGDRVYHMLCDHDSPLNEVKDALNQFIAYVIKVENIAAEAKKEQLPAEDAKPPEVKNESPSSND